MNIRTKQFQILTDSELIWKLMTEVYNHEESNGPAAPFFEYAITSPWMDKDYLRLNRIWLDGDNPVAFVFYEQPVSNLFFVLRPGYEFLAKEMVDYAETAYPKFEEKQKLVLLSSQTVLREELSARGYKKVYEEPDRTFDFRTGTLDYPLPEGYHFVVPRESDPLKVAKCLWDGFNSEEFGPFENWDIPTKNGGLSPHELYQNVYGATISPSPHATYDLNVIIADENDEYVCFSGMWWVPENHLAYMEPLCTVPAHQHKGLAQAALSKHDKDLRPLGAEIMTGGGNEFYKKIGYTGVHMWEHYEKEETNKKYPCPCCGCLTFDEPPTGNYDICPVCFWEDDPIALEKPDEELGCNGVSLTQAKKNYKKFGACKKEMLKHCRKPTPEEGETE